MPSILPWQYLGAFLQESLAVASAFYTYHDIADGETYGWQNFKKLSKAFENGLNNRFAFQHDGVSNIERSTYIVAALSVAFGQDFKQEFKDLNFSIDDSLYEECSRTIKLYIEGL